MDTVTYGYTDSAWGDLLTSYDGKTITYDAIGNPLTYGTQTFTWKQGRQLATFNDGTTTWSFTYDANGMRKSRTNGSATYTYTYNGSQLTQMTKGTDTLYFTYDAFGAPWTVKWNGTIYNYVTNLQGDIIAIVNTSNVAVVEYVYDAWGNVLSISGTMSTTLGTLNPLRYRGYVYDHETEFYYLQSRYYNPEWGRFLNADAFAATGQGMLGNNMFAYCGNNPVNCVDPSGNCGKLIYEIIKWLVEAVKTITDGISNIQNNNNTSIPEGGETVYQGQVRICTDGSDGTLVPDEYWYKDTALFHNGQPLDAYSVYYVVVPLNVDREEKLLGCSALLINHDTGMRVWCVVGDQGPSENGWGEVSIAAIWDTGNPDHMTANSAYGLGSNYEIILYRDRKYDFGD